VLVGCGGAQDPADRRGADTVAELEQLALDPEVPPARVLPRHPHHEGGEDVVDRWPSGPVGIGPSSADEAAMPAQDRVGGDQAIATQCSGQALDEGGEHGSVHPVQARSWVGATEDGDLVAQHEELVVLGGGRAAHQQDQREHLAKDQVQQPQQHMEIMPTRRSPLVSDPRPDFWHPTGLEQVAGEQRWKQSSPWSSFALSSESNVYWKQADMAALIHALARHASVVVIDHDMGFVRELGAPITVMHLGQVLMRGDLDELEADEQLLDVYLGRHDART
jgi:hypothetical protein